MSATDSSAAREATPRTNAAMKRGRLLDWYGEDEYTEADFARQLERERAALRQAIRGAQMLLADYLVPGSKLSAHETISKLLSVLDNEDLVRLTRTNENR